MKLISLLALIGITFTSTALADTELLVRAGETKIEKITITSETAIEAFSTRDMADISCEMYASDRRFYEQSHTHHCFGIARSMEYPVNVYISIKNNDKDDHVINLVKR